jgi:hypothetical protein
MIPDVHLHQMIDDLNPLKPFDEMVHAVDRLYRNPKFGRLAYSDRVYLGRSKPLGLILNLPRLIFRISVRLGMMYEDPRDVGISALSETSVFLRNVKPEHRATAELLEKLVFLSVDLTIRLPEIDIRIGEFERLLGPLSLLLVEFESNKPGTTQKLSETVLGLRNMLDRISASNP